MTSLWPAVEPAARLIVAILFNGLWQGALIAVAVWAMLRIFPNVNASTRYAAWSAALLAIIIVPLITTLPRVGTDAAILPQANGYAVAGAANVKQKTTHLAVQQATKPAAAVPQTRTAVPGSSFSPVRLTAPAWLALGLFGAWGICVLLSLARLGFSLVKLESLKRDAMPLGVEYRDVMDHWTYASKGSREVRICVSEAIEVPVAVGLFDAMILLPKHLLERLESSEIDQISLHELAHLRRADDWSNGLQRLAQALLFFNPAVSFVAHQMDIEREVACDDWVLAFSNDVRPYAFCLTKMAEVTAWPHRPLAAPGVFNTRKAISVRIERILAAKRVIGSALAPGASGAVLAVLIAAFFVLRMVTPSIAYTISEAGNPITVAKSAEPTPREPSPRTTTAPVPVHRASPVSPAAPATERPPAVVPGGPKVAALAMTISAFSCAGCDMHGGNWAGRDFHGAGMEGVNFDGADLHGANFAHATLSGTTFKHADLRNVSFRGANLQGCDISGARIDGADFTGANLTGCTMNADKLSPEQAQAILVACTGCDFHNVNLRGRDLRGISLTGVNMRGADLRDTDLSHATFMGVDFSHARLGGAKLNGTNFTGCDLTGVDLRDVDFSHAEMAGSSLPTATMH